MPQIPLYPPSPSRASHTLHSNPLPPLLQTPAGLAILELQGTINVPSPSEAMDSPSTLVGRIIFPDYAEKTETGENMWMKKVYFYVGKHQRLTGEVQELGRPLGVVRRRVQMEEDGEDRRRGQQGGQGGGVEKDELEIVEVVRWKVVFSNRPEPVGGMVES